MSYTAQELYNLLPAVYRVRDSAQGQQLRALIEILAREAGVVDADIARLYDNWFIETCQDWVAPYIGDLIGATPLYPVSTKAFSQKAYVANTLAYRRRSGTLAVLEQASADVTGWAARAVEFFQLLGWTQNLNHERADKGGTVDIRRASRMELIDTAFDFAAHTDEVRNIAPRRGRYNLPNIGIFLFRLGSFPLDFVSARSEGSAGRYLAQPMGFDLQLFNFRDQEAAIEHLAQEVDLPVALRRLPLYEELDAVRQARVDGAEPQLAFFAHPAVLGIRYQPPDNPGPQPWVNVPAEEILICHLEQWPAQRPSPQKLYTPATGGVDVPRPIQVAVDPVLGRLLFADGIDPKNVELRYCYGFPAELGGGPYERGQSVGTLAAPAAGWTRNVNSADPPIADPHLTVLQDAIDQWNAAPANTSGVILISDSRSYAVDSAKPIQVPEGSRLVILAAEGQRPHIRGDLRIEGTAAGDNAGTLILDGVLLEGSCQVLAGNLGGLTIAHSTLRPGVDSITVAAGNSRLRLRIERSICGPVSVPPAIAGISIEDAIVAAPQGAQAVDAPETQVDIEASTLDGRVRARVLNGSNSLFLAAVDAIRRQEGCLRFSYVAEGSRTPQRFRCQPDLALRGVPAADAGPIRARLVPMFTSRQFPQPAFYQLAEAVAREIATGGEDGAEMGAYYHLKQPQRETNVHTILSEYLRAGLEAGIFYAT